MVFPTGDPSTIFRRIRAVVIDPVDLQAEAKAVGERPLNESVFAIAPLVADINAAPAIVVVVVAMTVVASENNAPSDRFKFCLRFSVRKATPLLLKASAAFRFSVFQRVDRNDGALSAVALAEPLSLRIRRRNPRDDCEPAKSFAADIPTRSCLCNHWNIVATTTEKARKTAIFTAVPPA